MCLIFIMSAFHYIQYSMNEHRSLLKNKAIAVRETILIEKYSVLCNLNVDSFE